MRNTLLILLSFSLFFACSPKSENKIIFLVLHPTVLLSHTDNPQLYVQSYVEYHPYKKDLLIAKSDGDYYECDSVPLFGLDKFYAYKYDEKLKSQLDDLFNKEYEDKYYKSIDQGIDDRSPLFIIIEKDNILNFILYEKKRLPEELRQLVDEINLTTESGSLIPTENNISEKTMLNFQDSIFTNVPPPRLKKTIHFKPPVISE